MFTHLLCHVLSFVCALIKHDKTREHG